MSSTRSAQPSVIIPPPSKHQLAVMIWLAVFPTLVALNVALRSSLDGQPVVLRTFVLATLAVPIVIYGLMPQLHRGRARLVARALTRQAARATDATTS